MISIENRSPSGLDELAHLRIAARCPPPLKKSSVSPPSSASEDVPVVCNEPISDAGTSIMVEAVISVMYEYVTVESSPAMSAPKCSPEIPNGIHVPGTMGLFARGQILPLTFHVLDGPEQEVAESMIFVSRSRHARCQVTHAEETQFMEGVIVEESLASIIVETGYQNDERDWRGKVCISYNGSRALVTFGWILQCWSTGTVVDFKMYASRDRRDTE